MKGGKIFLIAILLLLSLLALPGLIPTPAQLTAAQPDSSRWIELVSSRTQTSKKYIDPSIDRHYAITNSVGPLHYNGPDWKDINNTIVASNANVPQLGLADLEMVQDDYEWFALQELNTIPLILYRNRDFPGSWITFNPQTLQWTNDLDQLAQVSMPVAGIMGDVSENRLRWPDAYGIGRDLTFIASANRMIKYLTLESYPGDPPQYILDGGNASLELVFNFRLPSGEQTPDIIVDGEVWDKSSRSETVSEIIFQKTSSGVDPIDGSVWYSNTTLFAFLRPFYWDSGFNQSTGTMVLNKQGPNLRVGIRVPLAFLQDAVYPVTVDPTVDVQVGAGVDDGWSRPGVFSNAGNSAVTGRTGFVSADAFHRFTDVTVPREATIDAADITFVRRQNPPDGADVKSNVYMEDADDAVAPTSQAEHAADVRTTAFTAWDGATWPAYPTEVTSPDFAEAVQEVVNRSGWANGNSMMVLFDDDGTVPNDRYYQSTTWDSEPGRSAQLHIEYTIPPGIYEMRQGPYQGISELTPDGTYFATDESLVVAFDMETLDGAKMKDFASGFDMTIYGPDDTTGLFGRAREFNGSGDYMMDTVSDRPQYNPTDNITLVAWIYPTTIGAADFSNVIIGKNRAADRINYALVLGGTDKVQFRCYNSLTLSSDAGAVQLNQWQSVGVTVSDQSTVASFYVNGEPVGTDSGCTVFSQVGGQTLVVGGQRYQSVVDRRFFAGKIGEVMMWPDREMNATEHAYVGTHRNYTFRFDSDEPDTVTTGSTWVRGTNYSMGAAVNDSDANFTLNVTSWPSTVDDFWSGGFTWTSYVSLTAVTTRYNFTVNDTSTNYSYTVDGVHQGTMTPDTNGNISFSWTSWSSHDFTVGVPMRQGPFQGIVGERPTGSEFISNSSLELAYDMETLIGGDYRDFSRNGLHGNVFGTLTEVAGLFGRATNFPGTGSNYITFTNPGALAVGTVSFWWYPDIDYNTTQGGGAFVQVDPGGRTEWDTHFTFGSGNVCSSAGTWVFESQTPSNNCLYTTKTSWPTGYWYHLMWTWDGSNKRVYINGTEDASLGYAGGAFGATGNPDVQLGRHWTGGIINGTIESSLIFSRVLSVNERSYISSYRNYTFKFNTTVPGDVTSGPTWVRGDNQAIGAAVNLSTGTVDVQVGVDVDDGWGKSSTIYITEGWVRSGNYSPNADAFMRFANVTVPSGATITAATMDVMARATNNDGSLVRTNIYLNDVDDAVSPTTKAQLDGKARTTAFAAWDGVDFVVDVWTTSPDISAAVQEVVDRGGWNSGNDMMILWDDDGTATLWKIYELWAYEGNSTKAIKLHIEWFVTPEFTINVTTWDSDDVAWDSYVSLTNTTTRYNFTLQASTEYTLSVDGTDQSPTYTTDAYGNTSFSWTSWSTRAFRIYILGPTGGEEGMGGFGLEPRLLSVILRGIQGLAWRFTLIIKPTLVPSNITWDFGDGDVLETTSMVVMHTYKSSGRYLVSVTVWSFNQQVGQETFYLQVDWWTPWLVFYFTITAAAVMGLYLYDQLRKRYWRGI